MTPKGQPMPAYHILSLDGGGIRGIFSARVLERLELAMPGFLGQLNLLAGTSTGGIIALGLAAGMPPAQLVRLYREEGLTVRKRKDRRRAIGARTPILVEARVNARWSLDFVHDQLVQGRRFRILNIVDDVTRECLAAIPDTSISGKRVARELTTLIELRASRG